MPFATQVSRQLTWLIATGAQEEGSLLPPISELAEQVGVNTHTMRAAYGQLRDDGLVRVQRGSRTVVLGYDRGLVSITGDRHSSFTIGVLIPSFASFYSGFLDAVTTAAAAEGWLPLICQTHHFDAPIVSNHLDQLFSRNVDGVIAIESTNHPAARMALPLTLTATVGVVATAQDDTEAQDLTAVSLRLLWFAGSQFAGEYVAQEKGFFTDEGLDVTINPGGFDVNSITLVAAGTDTFGLHDTSSLVFASSEGIPLGTVATFLQKHPGAIMALAAARGLLPSTASTVDARADHIEGVYAGSRYGAGSSPKSRWQPLPQK